MNYTQRLAHFSAKLAAETIRPSFSGPKQAARMKLMRAKVRRLRRKLCSAHPAVPA